MNRTFHTCALVISVTLGLSFAFADEIPIEKGQLLPAQSSVQMTGQELSQLYNLDFSAGLSELEHTDGWVVTSARDEGDQAAVVGYPAGYANIANESLILPTITLPALDDQIGAIRLKFEEWAEIESEYDYGRVLVSTDVGATWREVDRRSGASDWRTNVIDLSAYAGSNVLVKFEMVSDATVSFGGWQIDNVSIVTIDRATIGVTLNSLNSQNFPFIYMNATASRDGAGVFDYDENNFEVYENGVIQTDFFQVTPPEEGGEVRLVDIVFCMDNSGSMSGEQNAVRNNVINFVNALESGGVDFALGLTRFGQSAGGGNPIIEDGGILTRNADYFRNTVWNRNVVGGGHEPGYDALFISSTSFSFRPGSQKIFILITDESVTGDSNQGIYSQAQTISQLQSQTITAFALIELDGHSITNYGTICQQTNGAYFDIYSPFDQIFDYIGASVTSSYVVRYYSSNPSFDGVERHVIVEVHEGSNVGADDGYYTPGGSPEIQRTPQTIALENQSWAEGTLFEIEADITDDVSPFVNSARVYYRSTGSGAYEYVNMANLFCNTWRGIIPTSVVHSPGIDYYITASDGESTSSSPTVNPSVNPHQIAVLPNELPVITHEPVETYVVNRSIDISGTVYDGTNGVERVYLRYKKTGDLIDQEMFQNILGSGSFPFSLTIPQTFTGEGGIEYQLRAVDDVGTSSYLPSAGTYYHIEENPLPTKIVIVPGIMGSTLCKEGYSHNDDHCMWNPTSAWHMYTFFNQLVNEGRVTEWRDALDLNGNMPSSEVRYGEIDESGLSVVEYMSGILHTGWFNKDIWRGCVEHLVGSSEGLIRQEDVIRIPYDWRKEFPAIIHHLTDVLETLNEDNEFPMILAHSNGCLLVRAAMNARPDLFENVASIIFIAGPHRGSVMSFGTMAGLDFLDVAPEAINTAFGVISHHIPMAYHLLPTSAYTEPFFVIHTGDPTPNVVSREAAYTYFGIDQENLIPYANAFHGTLGSVDHNGLADKCFTIAGNDVPTMSCIHVDQNWEGSLSNVRYVNVDHGDGTVELSSARTVPGVPLENTLTVDANEGDDHAGMPSNTETIAALESIMRTNSLPPSAAGPRELPSDAIVVRLTIPINEVYDPDSGPPILPDLRLMDQAGAETLVDSFWFTHTGVHGSNVITDWDKATMFIVVPDIGSLYFSGLFRSNLPAISALNIPVSLEIYRTPIGQNTISESILFGPIVLQDSSSRTKLSVGNSQQALSELVIELDQNGDGIPESTTGASPCSQLPDETPVAFAIDHSPELTIQIVGDAVELRWTSIVGAQYYLIHQAVNSSVKQDFEIIASSVDTVWRDTVSLADPQVKMASYYVSGGRLAKHTRVDPYVDVACWAFDEGLGDVAFDALNPINNGAVTSTEWINEDAKTALSFSHGSYITVDNQDVFYEGDLKVETLVRIESYPTIQTGAYTIFSNWRSAPINGGIYLRVDVDGFVRAGVWDDEYDGWRSILSIEPIPLNEWVKITLILNGDDSLILFNDIIACAGNLRYLSGNNGMPLTIGASRLQNRHHQYHFRGDIDWLRITELP